MHKVPDKRAAEDMSLAEICMFLSAGVQGHQWQELYDMYAKELGGFPGIHRLTADWAIAFFYAEPEEQNYDFIEAIEMYTHACLAMARFSIPTDEMLRKAAKEAIAEWMY